ncbi:MAG: HmuY family protein [Saprospiraceae bacterium]|nr:HmuY family protein [Saprospiraceae bacterium]
MKNSIHLIFALFILAFVACKDDEDLGKETLVSTTIKNLAADPGTGFDPTNGNPLGTTGHYSFFRLADSSIVDLNDSATTKWDLAFRGSRIILNGGSSGPGTTQAFLQSGIFSDFKKVSLDSIFKSDAAPTYAIGSTWSTYNPTTQVLIPTPGKFIVLKTSDNKFCKIEILSYYKDAPPSPDSRKDLPRYFTFRYVYQSNGTSSFE